MIYIFGAGIFGKIVGQELIDRNKDFVYVVDADPKNNSLLGKPIQKVSDIKSKENDIAYITAGAIPLSESSQNRIPNLLEELGIKDVRYIDEIGRDFPNAFRKLASDGIFWRAFGKDSFWNEEKCSEFKTWLADERSQNLYENIKAFRTDPSGKNYIWPDIGRQYLDLNISSFPRYKHLQIADFGAWIGDTTEDFCNFYCERVKSYHSFEPDPGNFKKLNETTNRLKKSYQNTEFFNYPYATSDKSEVLRFSSSKSTTSALSSKGDVEVQAVLADEVLKDYEINYLKLDVEGAELATLKGAEKLIKNNRPDMAISLYHRASDFWELPHFVRELLPNSKMFLRQHHHWGLELTLYVRN